VSTSRKTDTASETLTTQIEPADGDTGGTVWDAPNQQVVREDQSAPWDEGNGGTGPEPKDTTAETTATPADVSSSRESPAGE